jgi:predicted Rossmann fold nucleotide-binding protein DprA/Smf involved in DNA uptake
VNMRNEIEQAALEVGRALAKYEMLSEMSAGKGVYISPLVSVTENLVKAGNGTRKRPGRVAKANAKAAGAGADIKAPAKARGARKASGPREKGVKARIASMIATAPLTVAEIIAHTGFKKTSVRATLMSLKKEGLAVQEGDAWLGDGIRAGDYLAGSNSDPEAHANL